MNKVQVYLIVCWLLFAIRGYSQTLPRVSKDKEIGFTNDHIGRTWDMLYNTDFGKGRDWNIQIPVQTNGIIVSSGSNGEAYTTRHSVTKSYGRKKNHVSPSEVNARINADREWRMEQARANREAERQRKRAEDNLSEMRARMQHAIATAPYYAQAADRDHWHATEGARILSEIKATDLIQMPQRQETSGVELAAGIKPKGKKVSSVEVVSLSILMKDKKLDNDSGQINVTENHYLDEQQMKSWSIAIDEEGLIDISSLRPSAEGKTLKPILLISHEELELDSLCPFVLPQYGLVSLLGDSLIMLKDNELNSIAWKEGCESSYVVVCGDRLIGKCGNKLNIVKTTGSEKLLEFDTDQFSIFPKDEKSIYAVCWYENISSIIRIDVDKREYSEIARLPLVVLTIAANDNLTLALVENDVFVIDNEGKPQKLFKTSEYVNDIVMSEKGLLVATDTHIILAKNAREQSILLNEGAKRLWCGGNDVYFQSMDNDLYLIEL